MSLYLQVSKGEAKGVGGEDEESVPRFQTQSGGPTGGSSSFTSGIDDLIGGFVGPTGE